MVKKVKRVKKSKKVLLIKVCYQLNGACVDPPENMAAAVWAFSSGKKRDDALRGILRDLVNEAEPDGHWCDYNDYARSVDDVLDEIIEDGDEYGVYAYEGLERSFRLEYDEVEVL